MALSAYNKVAEKASFCLYSTLSSEDQAQVFATQPRHSDVRLVEARSQQQRVVGSLLKPHLDLFRFDGHDCRGLHEVAEDVARLGALVAVAEALAQHAVQAAGDQRELQV